MQKRMTLLLLQLLSLYYSDRRFLARVVASGLLVLAYLASLWAWWVWMGYEAPLDELRTYTGLLVLSWPWWLGRIDDLVRYFGFSRDVFGLWSFSFWKAYYAIVAIYATRMLVTGYPDIVKAFVFPVFLVAVAAYFERGINFSEFFGSSKTKKSLVKTTSSGRKAAAGSPLWRIPQMGYQAGCVKINGNSVPIALPVTVILPAIWWGIMFYTLWFQGDLGALLFHPFPVIEHIPYMLEMVFHVPFAFAFGWMGYFFAGGFVVCHIYWIYYIAFKYRRTGVALTENHLVIACWTSKNPLDLSTRSSVIFDLQKITGLVDQETAFKDFNLFNLIEPAKGEDFDVKNFYVPAWLVAEIYAEIQALKAAAAKK